LREAAPPACRQKKRRGAVLSEPRPEPETPSRGRGARIARRLLVAFVVVAVVSASALALLLYAADAEFVAGALSRVLGRRVDVGSINLRLGPRLEVELTRVRVEDPSGPDAPPLLEIEHALGKQAWPRLLAGQLLPLDWDLQRPILRLAAVQPGGEPFDFGSIPRVGLSLRDGEVHYQPATGPEWSVKGLRMEAKRAVLGTRVEGEASGRIAYGEKPVTELSLRFSAESDQATARGTVAALDLAALPPTAVSAKGRASGSFELEFGYDARDLEADVTLDVAKLALTIPKLSEPLAPSTARLAGKATWKKGALDVALRELALDDLVANGTLRFDSGTPGRIAVDVGFAPFEPGRHDRLNPLTVLGARFDTWQKVASRIEAGVIENARIRIDVPRVGALDAISFDTPVASEAFRVELSARDGIYLPNPQQRLEHISGALLLDGNRMEIEKLHLIADGDALPEIHLRVDGMHRLINLPHDEDEVEGGPGADLAGLEAVRAALSEDEGPNEPPRPPPEIAFTDLAVRYPAFVLPLREASGRLRFPNGGFTADNVRGILGGAPATLEVRYDPALDTLGIDIRYLEGAAPGAPITGPRWLEGKIALPALEIADLPFENLRADVVAEGTDVTFPDIRADLTGGSGYGSGRVSLGQAERAPFEFRWKVKGFDVAPHVGNFGLPDRSVTGIGQSTGMASGEMRAGGDFSTEGFVEMGLSLQKGEIAQLPGLVAIARLPSLSGVSGLLGKPLPYNSLIIDLKLENGRLALTEGKLLGPQLRILAEGEMDLNTKRKETDLVVALLFLKTLDTVLGSLPIVRNVVLGKNQNLLALYLRVQGPHDDLSVTPLPPEGVRSVVGFASESVMKGVRALGRLIPIGRKKSDDGAAPEAPEAPPSTTPP
jgi:hypothetical protein